MPRTVVTLKIPPNAKEKPVCGLAGTHPVPYARKLLANIKEPCVFKAKQDDERVEEEARESCSQTLRSRASSRPSKAMKELKKKPAKVARKH